MVATYNFGSVYSHSHSFLLKEGQLSVTGKTPVQALLYLLDESI